MMNMNNKSQQVKLLIYGATGYTGTMICREAASKGLSFEIAGRNAEKLAELAAELNVNYHVFSVNDSNGWSESLKGKTALLNIAGPFSETADQAMEACIKYKVHYLDITAEVDIYRLAETKDAAAKAAGIMLMSGTGLFATYDPLAVHTAKRVKEPVSLRAAFKYSGGFTPGSIASSANIINAGILVRNNGVIEKLDEARCAAFDFGNGNEACFSTPLGGVVLCYKSTGIPNIEEYFQMALPASETETLKTADGRSEETLSRDLSQILMEVTGADGTIARSIARMPAGYMPTVNAAIEIFSRCIKGDFKIGFQSPGSAYGEKLLDTLPNVELIDF
jgi:short subunit dehydrogenase-like uncharacterized protein